MTRIWTFVHEPSVLNEMVLQDNLRPKLEKAIKEVPNLLIIGPAGVGKGTFAHIMLKETGYDYIWVNASDETGIDAMREKVRSFATALGTSDMKIVVLNECDSLTSGPQGAQKMLRQLMEDVQNITRFILLANYPYIIPEIVSRCQVIEMSNPPAKEIYKFATNILSAEKVSVKSKILVVEVIKKLYPDIRSIINTLQLNTINGVLETVEIEKLDELYQKVFDAMKAGNLEAIRKVLRSNVANYNDIYNYLYENVGDFKSPGDMLIMIGTYLYRHNVISIKEINFMAMVAESLKRGYV